MLRTNYRNNVDPLGYKAFLVGVDRSACAKYKVALDQILLPKYSESLAILNARLRLCFL